ncbi:MAG: MT-A70 family methyltransferase [Nitrospiria bacterium]
MKKIEREERPNQGVELDYPTMTIEEIAGLPVSDLAHVEGCHLYLWVTQKYLPAGLEMVEAWGLRYQCLMTWCKNVGFTPFSWMYDTEHVIFATTGNLKLNQLGLRLSFDAPVNGHSIKPDVFYQERVLLASPGPRLEMFARRQREGFEVWGNEV